MEKISERAAKVMKELRLERGISQQMIASAIGITRQAYSRYENGQREPGLDVINKICEVYNFSPVLLFFENYKNIDSSHIKLTGILAKYEEIMRLILRKFNEIKKNLVCKSDKNEYMINEEEVYKDNEKTILLKKEIRNLKNELPKIKKDFEVYLNDIESSVNERINIIDEKFIENSVVRKNDLPFDFF